MSSNHLDPDRHLALLREDTGRISAAAATDLGAAVPECDGWTVAELVGHVGKVFISVSRIVEARSQEIMLPDDTYTPPGGEALPGWFEDQARRVITALTDIDPAESVWTWSGVRDARFYHRRMANEAAIHRIDAERSVATDVAPVPFDQAADGIDEYYGTVLPFALSRWSGEIPTGGVALEATDSGQRWELVADGTSIRLAGDTNAIDATVRGTVCDLFLFAWNRRTVAPLEISGDEALVRAIADRAP